MPKSDVPPVPEDDDLNATEIEVMTDVEVLLDELCTRKRVEVSERKMTEGTEALRKGQGVLQSWLDHRSKKSLLIKRD